jgi:hypothetical protein
MLAAMRPICRMVMRHCRNLTAAEPAAGLIGGAPHRLGVRPDLPPGGDGTTPISTKPRMMMATRPSR